MSDASGGDRRALLIGVNDYLDEAIGNLRYCVNDVVEFDKIISDELRGNFSSQLLHSEMDSAKSKPNRNNIMSLTKLLANNTDSNDSILFYFAGHGWEESGVNYLLPADSCQNILYESAITLGWVIETLTTSPARKKFMIIDACQSGSVIGRSKSIPMSRSFYDEIFSEAEGFAKLTSCKMEQVSYEYPEKKHGVFSYYLLEGLKGAADNDGDCIITVPDAYSYTCKKLRAWSIANRCEQNPTLYYNVAGDFIFVRTPIKKTNEMKFTADAIIEIPLSEYRIYKIIDDISFMSHDELYSRLDLFDQLRFFIFTDNVVDNGKFLLKRLVSTRFSSSTAKDFLMNFAADVTEIREIKKWVGKNSQIKQFFIIEFITSQSFDYAGTLARIINNLLPILVTDELLEIIDAIEENDQIQSSFKARSHIWSIIDAAKSIIPLERYRRLLELLGK